MPIPPPGAFPHPQPPPDPNQPAPAPGTGLPFQYIDPVKYFTRPGRKLNVFRGRPQMNEDGTPKLDEQGNPVYGQAYRSVVSQLPPWLQSLFQSGQPQMGVQPVPNPQNFRSQFPILSSLVPPPQNTLPIEQPVSLPVDTLDDVPGPGSLTSGTNPTAVSSGSASSQFYPASSYGASSAGSGATGGVNPAPPISLTSLFRR